MKAAGEVIEVNLEELEALLERKREALGEEDYQKLQQGLRALSYLTERISDQDTTITQLRALLVKPRTEKTSKALEQAGIKPPPQSNSPPHPNQHKKPKPGHGRHGAAAYQGAERIKIAHGSLKSGDHCPECWQGKVYPQKDPALRIRVVGQAPIAATVYELERLRCNLCGEVYEAAAPPEVGDLFMRLIHTCELNGVNPFEYLIALQKHAADLAKNPAARMPWNYREALQQTDTSQPSA